MTESLTHLNIKGAAKEGSMGTEPKKDTDPKNDDLEKIKAEHAKLTEKIKTLQEAADKKEGIISKIKALFVSPTDEGDDEPPKKVAEGDKEPKKVTKSTKKEKNEDLLALQERQEMLEFELLCRDNGIKSNDEKEFFYFQLEKHEGDIEKAVKGVQEVFKTKKVKAKEGEEGEEGEPQKLEGEGENEPIGEPTATGARVQTPKKTPTLPNGSEVTLDQFNKMSLYDKDVFYRANPEQYKNLNEQSRRAQGWRSTL